MPIITTNKELHPRAKNDFYPTPVAFIDKALDLVEFIPENILDPGAGLGAWGKVAKEKWPQSKITGVEIQPEINNPKEYNNWYCQDFVKEFKTNNKYDLIIGNPPYKFAEEFIRKSFILLRGQMLLLLRLAFLESKKRGMGLWQEYPPKQVSICMKRPSFTGNNKTDATAYALFLWEKNWNGKTELNWLRTYQ